MENGQRRMPMSIGSVKYSITHAENGDTMLVQFISLVTIIVIIHPSNATNVSM